MDAGWRADAHLSMWGLAGERRLLELREAARRIAREVVTPALAAGAADSPGWTAAKAGVLAALDRAGLTGLLDGTQSTPGLTDESTCPTLGGARTSACQPISSQALGLAAAELAVADGGAATCLLSGFLAHSVVSDFGTPEQRARYLDRARFPHGALCLTEPPPGAGVDALTLTGIARMAESLIEVDKRGRFISHMEFADFVLLAVDFEGGCLIVAEPGDQGLFDRGQPVRMLGHRLSSVTSPSFRLRVPASRILGGYTTEDGRLVPRIGYRQALEPALARCRPVVALMTAGKLLATVETVLAQRFARISHTPPADVAQALALGAPPAVSRPVWTPVRGCDTVEQASVGRSADAAGKSACATPRHPNTGEKWRSGDVTEALTLVDAWADAEAAAALAVDAARMSDTVTGAAARLFASAHAAPHMAQYAGLPGVLGWIMDAQVEAVYLGAESVQRRLLAAAMAAPGWTTESGEPGPLRAAFALLGWTLEFLRRARLLSDARQGAGFALADALCRLLAARALAACVESLRADGSPCVGFFADLSVVESAAAASAMAQVSTSLVFGSTAPAGEDLGSFSTLRAAVEAGLAGLPAARLRAAAFLLARSIDNRKGP